MFDFFNPKPVHRRPKIVVNSSKVCKKDGLTYCDKKDKPLKPMIARAGGKTKLLPKIMPKIPEHKRYVEGFVGGGVLYTSKSPKHNRILSMIWIKTSLKCIRNLRIQTDTTLAI